MAAFIFSAMSCPLYLFFLIMHLPSLIHGSYVSCSNNFTCGTLTIGYPFYGGNRLLECGYPGLELDCDDDDTITTIEITNVKFRVSAISPDTQILTLVRKDLLEENFCLEDIVNPVFDSRLFNYIPGYTNLTFLYGCPSPTGPVNARFVCSVTGTSHTNGYVQLGTSPVTGMCHDRVVVPVKSTTFRGVSDVDGLLNQGFEVGLKLDNTACNECRSSSGTCGYDHTLNSFTCLCANQTSATETCLGLEIDGRAQARPTLPGPKKPLDPKMPETPRGNEESIAQPAPDEAVTSESGSESESESKLESASIKSKTTLGVGLGVGGALAAVIGIGGAIFLCRRNRKRVEEQASLSIKHEGKDLVTSPMNKAFKSPPSDTFTRSVPPFPFSQSELGRGNSYFGVQVFSYIDLEEATDHFAPSRELGDGGFGAVYHGTLPDGRVVAVKRLYENNFKRVQQFMNEVEILARLRHKNLVLLYGCTSKSSQELLLVYEFIENGTVADHLHGKRANSGRLTWAIRLNIAVETAEALAYLHESDIIHRDVKTTNILLDNGFHVKVADFGLSRLFPVDVTHVSTAPQGTPGYVDPEYYQCYHLTEKSDVYSFGVVLIELLSSLQAVDTNRHRLDINLANMAVNKIQNHVLNELVDPSLGFETDSSVRRKSTLVAQLAFRCLQQERDMRPSMREVLVALKEIQNEGLNTQNAEVVEIVVDDVALLNDPNDDTPTREGINNSTSDSHMSDTSNTSSFPRYF